MPRTGWTIGVLAWVLGVSALALQLTSGVPLLLGDLLFVVVDGTVALVYGRVAGVILVRRALGVGWVVARGGARRPPAGPRRARSSPPRPRR